MTSNQLSTFLGKVGISTNSWTEITNLARINLSSDGNIYVKETDMYKFDLTTNLLMIKEYYYKKVDNGWQLTQLSENLADIMIDFDNITGFLVGTPIAGVKSELFLKAYGG